jgi:uncharacterized protein
MFGQLNPEEIEKLMSQQYIGRIGCSTADTTYVVPISYTYDGEFIYAHTFEGMKIDMMRKNPNVCFEIENTKNLSNWQTVIAWGTFEELPEGPERLGAIKKLEERALPILHSETMHLSSQWPFSSDQNEQIKGIIFRIRLTKKTGRFERSADDYFFAT